MADNKRPKEKTSRVGPSLLLIVLLLLLSLELFSAPCFFYSVIGVPCAGCGSSRALALLLQGQIKEAIAMHPLILLSLLIFISLLTLIIVKLIMRAKGKAFRLPLSQRNWKILFFSLVALYLVVYIVRMLLYFPYEEPMCYNHNSVWGHLIALIRNITRR